MRPWTLILIGLLLSLLGIALPFLMLIGLVPSTFFLNFVSFFAMIAGLSLGVSGAAIDIRSRRK